MSQPQDRAARLRRRVARSVLPRLGVRVVRVEPGTFAVTRGRRLQTVDVDGGGRVVVPRRAGLEPAELGTGAVLLSSRNGRVRVTDVQPGDLLLNGKGTQERHALGTKQHRAQEKVITNALTIDHVMGVLALYRASCVIDVGANQGGYATRLRRAGYRGPIVSFEPQPEVFRTLEKAARDDPAWTVHNVALGRESTTMTMDQRPSQTGMSSLLPMSEFGRGSTKAVDVVQVDVQVRRLDELLDEVVPARARRRLFLKMDTQGYDLNAFAGLGERTAQVVAMQSELASIPMYEGMPLMRESLDAYEAAGFEVSALYPVRRQYRTARVVEWDCVMVRASAR